MSVSKRSAISMITVIVLTLAISVTIQQQRRSPKNEASVKGTQTKKSARAITAPRFVGQVPETIAKTPKEEPNAGMPGREEIPTPTEVPTAKSSDDEIRGFLAWLSSLDKEGISAGTAANDHEAGGKEANQEQEESLIESVIWENWKRGYETYDVERYMSSIWEDDFFYTSDTGTPDDPSDDIILRGGQREREAAVRVFGTFSEGIELNISPRSDIEFLSDTIAMVEHDYEVKFSQIPTPESKPEMFYSSGNMVIILERRENPEGIDEWRILEWYDYAQK